MAEGWAKKLKSDCIEPFSAGVFPTKVNDRAIKVMAKAGVDISNQYPKHPDDICGIEFDYVITLCDNAAELCPTYPAKTKIIHKPFADPTVMLGDEETVTSAFRKTRDRIKKFILSLPQSLQMTV
jgi:arsenate reductase